MRKNGIESECKMIKTLYWILRILAYACCLAGVAFHFVWRDAGLGIILLTIGFVIFFITYGLWFMMRMSIKRYHQEPEEDDAE